MPRTTAGETPTALERFDLRGLDEGEREALLSAMYRRIDALLGKFGFVAIRAMVAMTPQAAARRVVSQKAAKSAHFDASTPFADTRPIIQWTPLERVDSSLAAYEVLEEILYPEYLREEYDEEEALDGIELLIVEVTWHK